MGSCHEVISEVAGPEKIRHGTSIKEGVELELRKGTLGLWGSFHTLQTFPECG